MKNTFWSPHYAHSQGSTHFKKQVSGTLAERKTTADAAAPARRGAPPSHTQTTGTTAAAAKPEPHAVAAARGRAQADTDQRRPRNRSRQRRAGRTVPSSSGTPHGSGRLGQGRAQNRAQALAGGTIACTHRSPVTVSSISTAASLRTLFCRSGGKRPLPAPPLRPRRKTRPRSELCVELLGLGLQLVGCTALPECCCPEGRDWWAG